MIDETTAHGKSHAPPETGEEIGAMVANTPHRMTALQWIFQDRHSGRIVVAQMPNALALLFVAAFALTYILPAGWPATTARTVGFVGVALWAIDELIRGVNPWRRTLGALTLLSVSAYIGWTFSPR